MTDTALDLAPLDIILDEFKHQKGVVIPILQRVQETYGYLPKEVLAAISKKTHIPLSQLYGVATLLRPVPSQPPRTSPGQGL